MPYDDLALDGHRYDVRVLAAPLEYLSLLQQLARTARPDRSGVAALLVGDLEWQLESIAADVHRVVLFRASDTVCTCGLVMAGTDVVTSRGHRDLRTRRIAEEAYVVSHGQDVAERFAVVCPWCGHGTPASGLAAAHEARPRHRCGDHPTLVDAAHLREYLGLTGRHL